jgi:hypothetical protein
MIVVALVVGAVAGAIAAPSFRHAVAWSPWPPWPPWQPSSASTSWTTWTDWAVSLCTSRTAQSGGEGRYLAENDAAMSKMMSGMTIRPAGDVDRDFVAMMTAHHQGAIDMAVAVLRYGRNEKIRRLAQEIIVTQQQEIAAMRMAVGESVPRPASSPTGIAPIDAAQLH